MTDEKQFISDLHLSDLCKGSLKHKWFKGSHLLMTDLCPFCSEVKKRTGIMDCNSCICPKEICKDFGRGGFMHVLVDKYYQFDRHDKHYDLSIDGISDDDLNQMRDLFKKYIIDPDTSHSG
jgi:hypothetical protein